MDLIEKKHLLPLETDKPVAPLTIAYHLLSLTTSPTAAPIDTKKSTKEELTSQQYQVKLRILLFIVKILSTDEKYVYDFLYRKQNKGRTLPQYIQQVFDAPQQVFDAPQQIQNKTYRYNLPT